MRGSERRWAIGLSVTLHVVLLVVLLFWYLPSDSGDTPSAASLQTSDSSSAPAAESADAVPAETPRPADETVDVPPQQIQDSLESQIQQAQRLPDDVKLSELEKNLRRLDSMTDSESVAQTSATIAGSLGLDTAQYAEKETPTEGAFDVASAQIADVVRSQDDQGSWQFESIMVDAEGRTLKVPMGADEGERLYQTFETMKQFPMAKGIYQSVVMPMIQKMLEAESSDRAADENRVIEPQGSVEPTLTEPTSS